MRSIFKFALDRIWLCRDKYIDFAVGIVTSRPDNANIFFAVVLDDDDRRRIVVIVFFGYKQVVPLDRTVRESATNADKRFFRNISEVKIAI